MATPIFLRGKFHGQRSLVGYSLWGHKELGMTLITVIRNIKRLPLIGETRYPKLRKLVLFYVWEDTRVWAHWNHSFLTHLSYLGPLSCVFTAWVPPGLPTEPFRALYREWLQSVAARWKVFFSFLSFLRTHQLTLEGCNHWWLWHPCLLIW